MFFGGETYFPFLAVKHVFVFLAVKHIVVFFAEKHVLSKNMFYR